MHCGIATKGPLGNVCETGCDVAVCQHTLATERLMWALNFRVIFCLDWDCVCEIVSVTRFNY